jgi:hypothetical protein
MSIATGVPVSRGGFLGFVIVVLLTLGVGCSLVPSHRSQLFSQSSSLIHGDSHRFGGILFPQGVARDERN